MKIKIVMCVTFFMLIGCNSEDVKSVSYYKEHKNERIDKLKSCNKETRPTEECKNAAEAQHQVYFQK
ncbi:MULTISPECIES: EexN family lipoprotein [Enterobacteriaceae]|uniref:EexN family lipoprotein n=1 Tax=Enterobacteriaceae TaxID=543 RepID=UPI000D6DFA59|nr:MULTISPECIES: EexN family lipoprotein [Enterobacteriaceae]ELK8463440.1 EexN family lipoprotein [Salmonella enterica]HBB0306611.1 EexN family lipoprotein [Escherichia coli]HED3098998.1 EexN family lipoprotein [Citrobacter freundii]